ncbi:MAG: lipopolysaccharide biosynthesis protein [Candidatus Competibacteraceae bacterium]|nr:lipopolysaccharide biosynthesis protein [Candidatus Competibacteraceae bacterium]
MLRLVILRILESYFRHRWLYLLPIVLMSGLGVIFTLTQKPSFTAGGVLYVERQSYLASLTAVRDANGSIWSTPAQIVSQEFNELLRTDAFVRAIIQQTNLEEEMDDGIQNVNNVIEETRENVWATPLGDNQLLMNAVHEDPVIAYQIVTAAIDGYLQWRINAGLAETEVAQSFFSDLIATYEADLEAARAEMERYLEAHPVPLRGDRPGEEQLEIDRLQAKIDLAATRYASALDKEENTRLSMAQIESDARQTYFLIDAPHVPEESDTSLRKLALQAMIFVVVGVLLSGGLIVGTAIIDRSFRFPVDVVHRLDLPVLTMVADTPTTSEFPLRVSASRANSWLKKNNSRKDKYETVPSK